MILGLLKSPPMSPRLLRLKNSALFGSLKPLELKIVDGLMHERRYLPGEIVFDEGDEGQALYLVMNGRVAIHRGSGGERQHVADLGPGNFFGELALLNDAPRNAQARATEDSELAVFFRADFLSLMETDAVIGYKISLALARQMAQRLGEWKGPPELVETP
ncbi:cyclic nucleotide-binding domain-containing protein [Massilia agilis]|uniref:Cyclic nucleotide-binding domain-containing protein n=1 Tax=Massilia agilis TaxID=1811226 RepID=A0ABT2DGD8_9BURK|nr:cyclic nucleotide-binding domain-containing protein [Massilia agilis]